MANDILPIQPTPLYIGMGLCGCNEASICPGAWNNQGCSDLVYSPANVLRGSNIASLGAMPIFEARHGCLDGRRRLFDLP